MLQILTENNIALDLEPKTVINLELTNPMFDKQGSHSKGFDLPASAKNLREMGFPDRVDSLAATKQLSVQVLFDGLMIMRPTLTVKKFDGKIRAWLAENEGDFYQAVRDKMLQDFEYETGEYSYTDFATELLATLDASYPDKNYVVYPVHNAEFYNGCWIYDNDPAYNNRPYINYGYGNGAGFHFPTGVSKSTYTLFPYLCYVLDTIFAQSGYNVVSNVFYTNTELRTLTIFNLNAVGVSDPNTTMPDYYYDLGKHLPKISVSKFLSDLQNYFNVTVFVNNLNSEVRIIRNDEIIGSGESILLPSVNIKGIEPQYADGIFIKYTADNDDYYNNLVKDVYDGDIELNASVANYAALVAITTDPINSVRLVVNENRYYRWQTSPVTPTVEWLPYSFNLQSYKTKNGEVSYKSDISTLFTYEMYDDNGLPPYVRDLETPILKQPGNDAYSDYEQYGNDFKLRLLFYRGWIDDSNGYPSPFASGDIMLSDGTAISGATLSLGFWLESGVFENFWKNTEHWICNKRKLITSDVVISSSFIQNLRFYFKRRFDEQNYLIKKITIQITNDRILPAEAEMYTV